MFCASNNVLDYFDQKCIEAVTNPGLELECKLTWSVIQRLALPYADQPGYRALSGDHDQALKPMGGSHGAEGYRLHQAAGGRATRACASERPRSAMSARRNLACGTDSYLDRRDGVIEA